MCDALAKDLRKCRQESIINEVELLRNDLRGLIMNLREYAAPEKVLSMFTFNCISNYFHVINWGFAFIAGETTCERIGLSHNPQGSIRCGIGHWSLELPDSIDIVAGGRRYSCWKLCHHQTERSITSQREIHLRHNPKIFRQCLLTSFAFSLTYILLKSNFISIRNATTLFLAALKKRLHY